MTYLERLIDSNDPASVKRFILLATFGHYIIASFALLGFTSYGMFNIIKGSVDLNLLNALTTIVHQDEEIILIMAGVIGSTELVGMISSRFGKVITSTSAPKVDSATAEPKDIVKDIPLQLQDPKIPE